MPRLYCRASSTNEKRYQVECVKCHWFFAAAHPRGRYCSNKCKQRAKRDREKGTVLQLLVQERDLRRAGKTAAAKKVFAQARLIRKSCYRLY